MRLLDATRAHVGFALRRSGEQVLANVLHVAELARQYERNDGLSFRGFVETLREAAERGDAAEAPIVEDGSDGVRLMTVHKAKGLEFPGRDPGRHHGEAGARSRPADRSTRRPGTLRAADRRVVPRGSARPAGRGAGARPGRGRAPGLRGGDARPRPAGGPGRGRRAVRGWMGESAQPRDVSRRRRGAGRRTSAAGCPPFKRDSVLERPDGGIAAASTVSPGLHRMGDAATLAHDVVWWDPAALHLDVAAPFGLRREELIARDVPPQVIEDGANTSRQVESGAAGGTRAGMHPMGVGEHDDRVGSRRSAPRCRRPTGHDRSRGRTSGRRAIRHAGPCGAGDGAARRELPRRETPSLPRTDASSAPPPRRCRRPSPWLPPCWGIR